MNPVHVVFAAAMFVSMITSIVLVVVLRRRTGASAFRGLIPPGMRGSGEADGVPFDYHTGSGGKNSPPYLLVRVPAEGLRPFRLTRETSFDRFFRRLGLNVEMRTFDAPFDERFYIHSNHTGFARALFGERDVRKAATHLHGRGFRTIACDGRFLSASWCPFRPESEVGGALLADVARKLVSIARTRVAVSGGEADGPPNWRLRRAAVFAVPFGLDAAGTLALVLGLLHLRPADPVRPILLSLAVSIPLLLLFLWGSFHLLRGRSSSHREWIIAAAVALFAFPLAGAGGAVCLKGWLDRPGDVTRRAPAFLEIEARDENGSREFVVLENSASH